MCRIGPTATALSLACALGLAGCTGAADDSADAGPEPERTLTIGQGDEEGQGFTVLEDGDDAHLRYGSQGGFHVFFAAQVTGFEEQELVFEIRAYRDDLGEDVRANQMLRQLDLEPTLPAGTMVTTQADLLILCPSPSGIGSNGKPYRIWATARDSFSRTAHAEVDVVTVCPPDDPRCPPTCAGD